MTAWRSYKFRLVPTAAQEEVLKQYIHCTRTIWNKALELQQSRLAEGKNFHSADEIIVLLKDLMIHAPFFPSIDTQPLRNALRDQDSALENFSNGKKNMPKFKAFVKGGSIKFHSRFKVMNSKVLINSIGAISFIQHRAIDGDVKRVTILKSADRWFVSFLIIKEYPKPLQSNGASHRVDNKIAAVGIDLGTRNFATFSDGTIIEPINSLKRFERQIALEQSRLSRKIKWSKSWQHQREKVEKLYIRAANARTDFLHKLTTKISKEYSLIVLEDLNVNVISASRGKPDAPGPVHRHPSLSRSILDQGWRRFRVMLEFKVKEQGGTLVTIDPRYTSLKCSQCSFISKSNRPARCEFKCIRCGYTENADLNAAKNILAAGLAATARRQSS